MVAFAEEEGQRYPATFLGSGALTGHFDPAWLDQVDAQGVPMRDAMARNYDRLDRVLATMQSKTKKKERRR